MPTWQLTYLELCLFNFSRQIVQAQVDPKVVAD